MSEPPRPITFYLHRRWDRTRQRWWLVIDFGVGMNGRLALIPNTVASRSVIVPSAHRRLQAEPLSGTDVVDLQSGLVSRLIRNVRLAGQPVPGLDVRVRDVPELRAQDGEYVVDGYVGLDYLLGAFAEIQIETRRLRITLHQHSKSPDA